MEFQDDCDDDEEFEDGFEMDVFNIVDEVLFCKIGIVFFFGVFVKFVVFIVEIEFLFMEMLFEVKECVFCKRKVWDVCFVLLVFYLEVIIFFGLYQYLFEKNCLCVKLMVFRFLYVFNIFCLYFMILIGIVGWYCRRMIKIFYCVGLCQCNGIIFCVKF